ncbi:hypothetical protein AsAng_0016040 [Aureispira anguillae]|uniref:Uncharacterized protein n=1 Tax=Aureispira anguillae TaxID=2864201 RepID=A0A915YD64_9BACT|nr:hypothetical protein AsAng_0016040 [Aureispira anguillae]
MQKGFDSLSSHEEANNRLQVTATICRFFKRGVWEQPPL